MKNLRPGFAVLLLVSVAVMLAGCGKNYYFAGRALPPSGVANRVLVAVQNPSSYSGGALYFDDAYYDVRGNTSGTIFQYSISGYSGRLPITIQNMPEEQLGAVYASGDGSYTLIDYQNEKVAASIGGIAGLYPASVFITRNKQYVFAASPLQHVFTVETNPTSSSPGTYSLNLPNTYRVSVNPGGSVVLIFLQDSDQVYYLYHLQPTQSAPAGAADCEPQNNPQFCILPLNAGTGSTGSFTFSRPTKAVFSADGSTVYVLNCGPECGGTTAGLTAIPASYLLMESGTPGSNAGTTSAPLTAYTVPGGVDNAVVAGSTIYIAGQQQIGGLFGGFLSIFNTTTNTVSATNYAISDGVHGRMILADDNTLWISSTLCNEGVRAKAGTGNIGCLTMFNTSTNTVTIDPYKGDATGVAAVTDLHKVYVAEGGQVHIYKTTNMTELDNEFVTVTGTAYDVAYMDALTDANNTVY